MLRRERSLPTSRGIARPVDALRCLGFWLAIGLPAIYLPLLSVGLDERTSPVLAGLLALNLVSLLVGHEYSP